MKRTVTLWLTCLILGIATAYSVFSGLPFNGNPRARFLAQVLGTAQRPFVYRCLVGLWLRAVHGALPSGTSDWLAGQAQQPFWAKVLAVNGLPASSLPYVVPFVATAALCFAGYGLCHFYLSEIFYPEFRFRERIGWTIAGLLLANAACSWFFYIYDAGTWLLFPLALLLALKRQWSYFWPVFVLAALNKETAILLLPVIYHMGTVDPPANPLKQPLATTLSGHRQTIAAALVWVATQTLIKFAFRHNHGPTFEWHLYDLGLGYASPKSIAHFFIFTFGLGLFVARGWKEKPALLRFCFVWIYFPMCVCMATVGVFLETRAWYEVFALAYLLAIPALRDLGLKFWPGGRTPTAPAG